MPQNLRKAHYLLQVAYSLHSLTKYSSSIPINNLFLPLKNTSLRHVTPSRHLVKNLPTKTSISCQKALWSASHDGHPHCYELPQARIEIDDVNTGEADQQEEEVVSPSMSWLASTDCINGIRFPWDFYQQIGGVFLIWFFLKIYNSISGFFGFLFIYTINFNTNCITYKSLFLNINHYVASCYNAIY